MQANYYINLLWTSTNLPFFSIFFTSPLVFLQRNTVWNEMHISYIFLGILQMKTLYGFVWDISKFSKGNYYMTIGHFTVVCLVPWPLNRCEAGGDPVLLQTCLLFKCKSWYSHANKPVNMTIILHLKNKKVCSKQGHCQPRVYSKARALSTQL